MLFVVQDGLSRPRLYRPARPRVLYTRPRRSIPHNEPIALRQLQRRHPHQPPRYQSGALLLHELCRRVQPCGCMTDCLTPEEIHYILISSQCALLLTELKALGECRGGGHRYEGLLEMVRSRRDQNTDEQDRQREQDNPGQQRQGQTESETPSPLLQPHDSRRNEGFLRRDIRDSPRRRAQLRSRFSACRDPRVGSDRMRDQGFADSAVEGNGFEPSVPRR